MKASQLPVGKGLGDRATLVFSITQQILRPWCFLFRPHNHFSLEYFKAGVLT